MRFFRIVALCLVSLALFLAGCERAADVATVQHLIVDGIDITYPGNWKVEENQSLHGVRYIQFASTGSALLTLTLGNPASKMDFTEYTGDMATTLKDQVAKTTARVKMSEVKITDVSTANERGADLHYTARALGTDVPHTMAIRERYVAGRQIIIAMQVADEDRPLAQPGFDLIANGMTKVEQSNTK